MRGRWVGDKHPTTLKGASQQEQSQLNPATEAPPQSNHSSATGYKVGHPLRLRVQLDQHRVTQSHQTNKHYLAKCTVKKFESSKICAVPQY